MYANLNRAGTKYVFNECKQINKYIFEEQNIQKMLPFSTNNQETGAL